MLRSRCTGYRNGSDKKQKLAPTLNHLNRLAAKPGVRSTLVLSKADGTIIQSTGLSRRSELSSVSAQETKAGQGSDNVSTTSAVSQSNLLGAIGESPGDDNHRKSAEEIAKMVFTFVSGANDFAGKMDNGDEAKLVRMRTKKSEIVIVPGQYAAPSSLFPIDRHPIL